jgi:hypothetical protein
MISTAVSGRYAVDERELFALCVYVSGMRRTLKQVFTEYGAVALTLYLLIFFLVLGGVWVGLRAGWHPAGATGKAGTFAAAYIITKLTQPLRIGVTVVLTPIVGRWLPWGRRDTLS